jgi:hypothetical protein
LTKRLREADTYRSDAGFELSDFIATGNRLKAEDGSGISTDSRKTRETCW